MTQNDERTLRDLMDLATDDTWFHIVDGDDEHFFFVADYIGWHSETMEKLRPLLGRTLGEAFSLEIRRDPEDFGRYVPMVRVELRRSESNLTEGGAHEEMDS